MTAQSDGADSADSAGLNPIPCNQHTIGCEQSLTCVPDSHLTLILTTIRYGFSWLRMNYYGGMAQFSYRTSFVAAALTYGIVVYKTQRARAKSGTRAPGGYIGLLADENVQYLGTTLPCASKLCPGRR